MRRECDNRTIDGARGEGNVGRVVGMREYGQIAALMMAMRGGSNGGQTAMLAMDTHDEGDDGQIAGTRGDGSAMMGESSRSRWPCTARHLPVSCWRV